MAEWEFEPRSSGPTLEQLYHFLVTSVGNNPMVATCLLQEAQDKSSPTWKLPLDRRYALKYGMDGKMEYNPWFVFFMCHSKGNHFEYKGCLYFAGWDKRSRASFSRQTECGHWFPPPVIFITQIQDASEAFESLLVMMGNQGSLSCSTPWIWSDFRINMISCGNLFHGQINCWKKPLWFQWGLVISLRSALHLNIKQTTIHLSCRFGPFCHPFLSHLCLLELGHCPIKFKQMLVYWWAVMNVQMSCDTWCRRMQPHNAMAFLPLFWSQRKWRALVAR